MTLNVHKLTAMCALVALCSAATGGSEGVKTFKLARVPAGPYTRNLDTMLLLRKTILRSRGCARHAWQMISCGPR